ncbi:hypothetical protein J2I47_07465 [Fibrella sp. HMF5335]|uniref:Uncharacterized protein n=1 Tax=Fibrella rubiginis TaxID=2817060 RepID=A0A939K470_9BACT|nr:hypothetical protein [Fibrella rubiginis]MBO0936383.1 hypothetical protein [Fibrella rubiginis]
MIRFTSTTRACSTTAFFGFVGLRVILFCWLNLWLVTDTLARRSTPASDSAVYATFFSPSGRQVLRAADLEGIAREWLMLHQLAQQTPDQYRQYQLLHDRMRHRLWVTQLQVSATAAELDNEEEQAERVGDAVRERQGRREHRFTVASIVVSALTSVVSGVILSRNRGTSSLDVIGVVGGVAGVGLSLPNLLQPKGKWYEHKRNALASLWLDQNDTDLIAPTVWRFMHDRPGADVATLRDELVNQWKESDRANPLYFSEGGRYTADQLATRAAMLDQAEAYVKQIQKSISELATTLDANPPTTR